MKLVSMQLPKNKKTSMPEVSEDKWPYGLNVSFETEQVAKLPLLQEVNVGDKVMVYSIARVTRVEETSSEQRKPRHRVSMQLEKIDLEKITGKKLESMNNSEYRIAREAGQKK